MLLICSYFLRYLSLNVLISMVLTQQIACSFRSTTPMTCVSTPKYPITVRGYMQRVVLELILLLDGSTYDFPGSLVTASTKFSLEVR